MTIDELIEKLRAMNTGLPTRVLLGDGTGQFWDVDFEYSRVGIVSPEPYLHDDDAMNCLILRPSKPITDAPTEFDYSADDE